MAKSKYEDIEPHDVGDAYLLVGYPAHEMATVAFAYMGRPRDNPLGDRWIWCLAADDGDQYEFAGQPDLDGMAADGVILLRRVRDGLRERIPAEWRDAAWRYTPWLRPGDGVPGQAKACQLTVEEIVEALTYASEGRENWQGVKPDLLGNQINRIIAARLEAKER